MTYHCSPLFLTTNHLLPLFPMTKPDHFFVLCFKLSSWLYLQVIHMSFFLSVTISFVSVLQLLTIPVLFACIGNAIVFYSDKVLMYCTIYCILMCCIVLYYRCLQIVLLLHVLIGNNNEYDTFC